VTIGRSSSKPAGLDPQYEWSIEVVAGTGDSLEIHVEKSWRNSDPQERAAGPCAHERGPYRLRVVGRTDRRCNEGGDYKMKWREEKRRSRCASP